MRLFAVPKDRYTAKAELVSLTENYQNVAISMSDKEYPQLSIPQAANDLLTLEDVDASIVAVKTGDVIRLSARSMGKINVQVLMEYLGGGGHLTMAGAQLTDMTLEEAREKICESIDKYKSKQETN